MIDHDRLHKSVKRLALQLENHQGATGRAELTTLDREALAESVMQRFKKCYDTLWKHLKRYLAEEQGLTDIPNSPKQVFRLANENYLLSGRIEQWLHYANTRTATAHDYSGEKAEESLAIIPHFLTDAIGLYEIMTRTCWK
ncbi:MAG: nucleotidyltransferase substrate binding protein [Candidatus Hydrogenedentes bacterium]|nr:nucleotidyltransferase substrate binding protein [Candidatus Hydrogenedentota bacterium]